MLNAQVSKLSECNNSQCINALNHCYIDNSLSIAHCSLIIEADRREAV